MQWSLGEKVEEKLGFQRTLEVLLLSSASGSLLSAWGHLNQRRQLERLLGNVIKKNAHVVYDI